MRALRFHGRRDLRVEDVSDAPEPQAGEVRVAVEWCGICGTDVEEYLHGPLLIRPSVVLGHEVSGRVVDVGPGVTALTAGDLVALDGSTYCGQCPACRRHELNLCREWGFIGFTQDGGLAERLTVDARMAYRAKPDTAAESLALAEPFSVAVRALRRGRLRGGERVAVLGGGPVGIAVAQVAIAGGAEIVTLVEPLADRRDLAGRLGMRAVDPPAAAGGALRDNDGDGPDLVVDCTGSVDAPLSAIRLARRGGRIVLVGVATGVAELSWAEVLFREVEVIGCIGHVHDLDFEPAVRLIEAGRVDPRPLVSHRLALADAVEGGLELLAGSTRASAMKILVRSGGT